MVSPSFHDRAPFPLFIIHCLFCSRVLRGGEWGILHSRDLVPGDVVRLRGGDFVPAGILRPVREMKFHISSPSFCLDMSLAKGEIDVDQSPLTGESELVTKSTAEGRGEVFTTTDFLVQRGL